MESAPELPGPSPGRLWAEPERTLGLGRWALLGAPPLVSVLPNAPLTQCYRPARV